MVDYFKQLGMLKKQIIRLGAPKTFPLFVGGSKKYLDKVVGDIMQQGVEHRLLDIDLSEGSNVHTVFDRCIEVMDDESLPETLIQIVTHYEVEARARYRWDNAHTWNQMLTESLSHRVKNAPYPKKIIILSHFDKKIFDYEKVRIHTSTGDFCKGRFYENK